MDLILRKLGDLYACKLKPNDQVRLIYECNMEMKTRFTNVRYICFCLRSKMFHIQSRIQKIYRRGIVKPYRQMTQSILCDRSIDLIKQISTKILTYPNSFRCFSALELKCWTLQLGWCQCCSIRWAMDFRWMSCWLGYTRCFRIGRRHCS